MRLWHKPTQSWVSLLADSRSGDTALARWADGRVASVNLRDCFRSPTDRRSVLG